MRKPLSPAGAALLSQKVQSQVLSRLTDSKSRLVPRLRWSPTRLLALFLRSSSNPRSSIYRRPFLYIAAMRNSRLPVLTMQTMLAQKDLSEDKYLAAAMANKDDAYWEDTFNSLATRGWTKQSVQHWAWILSGQDGDARIERLLSTDTPQPLFLIMVILRNDEIIRKAESLSALMHYMKKHHLSLLPADFTGESDALPPAFKRKRQKLDKRMVMTITQFLIVLRRLVGHIQKVWPRAIVTSAHLAANYIKAIPFDPHHRHHISDYKDQCLVYNTALVLMGTQAPNQPLANREFNWRAQRVLLTMSNNLSEPLIINRDSYRAIRKVLIGLKKTKEETSFALRYGKSWPPHRQDFDGRDAKRTIDDDRSRSIKAGVLMKESGYPDTEYDRALDALGGMSDDSTPTIQTRSLAPKEFKDDKEVRNAYSNWAMNVRSTRNAQEAWRAFNKFAAKTGLTPTFQVYAEIILKLLANPIDPESRVLPGDTREVFPVHKVNYSVYEQARLSPPTVADLYAEMRGRGIQPFGHGLYSLVRHAQSLEEGLQYLEDSGISTSLLEALSMRQEPDPRDLRKIPLLSFNAYIELLCRLQPNRQVGKEFTAEELGRIHHAIKLVHTRLTPDTTEGATFRPPWYSILRALARADIIVQQGSSIENNKAVLSLFMSNFDAALRHVGIDAEIFILLCRVVQKVTLSTLRVSADTDRVQVPLLSYADRVLQVLTGSFGYLTTPITNNDEEAMMPTLKFQFPLGTPHLHSYMRALASLGAKDQMAELVAWMLKNYEYVDEEANRIESRGHAMIGKTLCAFQAYAFPDLEQHVQKDLINRMKMLEESGSKWRWPTREEVDSYVNGDRQGGSDLLALSRNMQRSRQQQLV
ncbi:hypothetical protein F5Y17DRAFT_442749 [Xylariaceae sp. FL0594]|nr:hypothetical protein F5Y17DRAFT_442749 [Xylariaceae sp. FL0594]